jgi:hypothetical protein
MLKNLGTIIVVGAALVAFGFIGNLLVDKFGFALGIQLGGLIGFIGGDLVGRALWD